jgi:hypothetical protein
MARKKFVAILAGIVDAAASHPDSDDVDRRTIMGAPGLRVYLHSVDTRFHQLHILIRTQCSNRLTCCVRGPHLVTKTLLPFLTRSDTDRAAAGRRLGLVAWGVSIQIKAVKSVIRNFGSISAKPKPACGIKVIVIQVCGDNRMEVREDRGSLCVS